MNTKYDFFLNLIDKNNKTDLNNFIKKERKNCFYFFYIGEINRIKGFFEKALTEYKKVKISKITNEEKNLLFLKMASCYRTLGQKDNSLKFSKMLLNMKVDDLKYENLLEYAMSLRLNGNFKEAIKIFLKLISFYFKEKDYQSISYIYWALGGIYRLTGNFKKSIDSFQNSYKFALRENDNMLKVYALFGLGGVLRVSGNIEKAYKAYSNAKKYIDNNDNFGKAYILCGTSNVLRQKGDLRKAESYYKKSLKLYSLINDKPDLAFVYWGLGEVYKKKGKLKIALNHFKIAEKLFKFGYEKRGEILNMISMSQTIYLLGDINLADKIYFKALKEAKKENLKTYLEIFT